MLSPLNSILISNWYDAGKRDLITVDKSRDSGNKNKQKYAKMMFQTGLFEAMINKLGLSWAKLSPSWNWTVIKIFYIELIIKI